MGTSLVRPWSHKICSVKTHRKITNFCFAVLCWRWLCVYQTSLTFKVQFFSRPPASLSFDGPVAQGPGSSRALSPWVAGPLEGLSILCSIRLVTRFTFFPDSRVNGSLWTFLRASTFFAFEGLAALQIREKWEAGTARLQSGGSATLWANPATQTRQWQVTEYLRTLWQCLEFSAGWFGLAKTFRLFYKL